MFEHQMLEAEISLLTDKIGRLQDKVSYHSCLVDLFFRFHMKMIPVWYVQLYSIINDE